jgi:hypothetical protein
MNRVDEVKEFGAWETEGHLEKLQIANCKLQIPNCNLDFAISWFPT